jgi:hypothetical protein
MTRKLHEAEKRKQQARTDQSKFGEREWIRRTSGNNYVKGKGENEMKMPVGKAMNSISGRALSRFTIDWVEEVR